MDNKQDPPLTPATALAERNKLMQDKQFFEDWMAGKQEALDRFDKVTRGVIGGDAEHFTPAPENFGRQGDGQGKEIFPGSEKWKG